MNRPADNYTSVPVSVIVPCYRCSATIDRAVESISLQTARPAEVILIDDGSGDDTLAALQRLQQRHGADWIKVIVQEKNSGPSVVRNAGWAMATQPYLAFLDADDSWHPRKIELQYGWMAAHPEVALTGHAVVVLRGNEEVPEVAVPLLANQVSAKRLLLSNRFSTPTVMLKRNLGFRFEPAKRCSEDYLLWLSMVLRGHIAYRFEAVLAYLHKEHFGEGGLSGQLWAMERGELDAYRQVYNEKLLSALSLAALSSYSLIKFVRRVLVHALKHIGAG